LIAIDLVIVRKCLAAQGPLHAPDVDRSSSASSSVI
jgi:hypothetical protein